jgi:hypothetical protein
MVTQASLDMDFEGLSHASCAIPGLSVADLTHFLEQRSCAIHEACLPPAGLQPSGCARTGVHQAAQPACVCMCAVHAVALYGKGRPPLGDRSPLHFAAERGGPVILEALIAAGAKVGRSAGCAPVTATFCQHLGTLRLRHEWEKHQPRCRSYHPIEMGSLSRTPHVGPVIRRTLELLQPSITVCLQLAPVVLWLLCRSTTPRMKGSYPHYT